MAFDLVVTIPFADYKTGDRISDPAEVEKYVGNGFTVKVAKPPEPPKKPGA